MGEVQGKPQEYKSQQPAREGASRGREQSAMSDAARKSKSRDVFTEFDSKGLKGDFEENGFCKV